ncbi:magnesium transporter [Candidatus Endowatersipora endosymbiont of Watersipora subatra]|uniref:magnesium transporter n=1 Tax=Candidatus Endowatersipora endosymbiont of Watersipora subatra TaxID=3077946 RepID=UPI00312C6CC0
MKEKKTICDPSELMEVSEVYSENGVVLESFINYLLHAIQQSDVTGLREAIRCLHESEVGDILATLSEEHRILFVEMAGPDFDFAALTEVDDAIRLDIVDQLPNQKIARAVCDLDSDDAVYILEDLKPNDQEDILAQIPVQERIRLRRSLDYPQDSAGRRMQTEFIAVPPFWTVGQAIDYIRASENLPNRFSEIFTIEPTFKLSGILRLDTLLRAGQEEIIDEIHDTNAHPILATDDQEAAAQIFEQYDLLSAPVVDNTQRLVGVLTIDNVVDVIQEEVTEDIRRLAGVGDEELSDRVHEIFRSRIGWLFINLCTAILASVVIGLFNRSLEQMVALAIMMPIVASMGGNAGTQTMTVAVRAIAIGDLDTYNTKRIIKKELLVGLINGISFAFIIGVITIFCFGLLSLGFIIGIAMIINMIVAAASGIIIPLIMNKVGFDPAIASSIFVTTVTDIVGFLAFLGLSAWWFGVG